MNSKIVFLLILLATQVGFAMYLFVDENQALVAESDLFLLDIKEPGQIDKIMIEADGKMLVLEKKKNQWLIPDYHALPVSDGQVKNLLNKLASIKTGWVVGQTKSAANRFHVADENSKRYLVLYKNGKKEFEIMFGDSAGLNSIYTRRKGDTRIYNIKLGLYLLSVTETDWFDKNILQVKGELSKISGDGFELIRQDGVWQLADLKKNEKMNKSEVDLLVSYLEKIQVERFAADVNEKDLSEKANLSYLVFKNDEQVRYDFYKNKDSYIVKSSEVDFYFNVAAFFYENIQKLKRKNFILL